MKYFKRFLWFSIAFFCLLFHTGFSQQPTSNSRKASNDKGFKLFFEKVYLHFDRQIYASGEDIWFKAYLVNGQSNWLTGSSNNLYVELISSDSKLVDRKVIRLENGVGNGDFQLKDSIPEGKYHVRAYTNWMLNFRNCFIFEKDIQIHSIPNVKPQTKPLIPDTTKYDVLFFPEGGSLLADVVCNVGFKSVDAIGNGCDVKGSVISSDGDTVGMFESSHLGMGKMSLFPILGKKYFAVGKIKNSIPFRKELPNILSKGFVMRVTHSDTTNLLITIATNQETLNEFKDKETVLRGQSFGKVNYAAKFKLTTLQVSIKIPKSNFPTGIVDLTLLDNNLKPYCERLAYIEGKNDYNISVTSDKKTYKAREDVILKIKVQDGKNRPAQANLSLTVVDANQAPFDNHSIVSYLMLESEIKGKIEKPSQYFDTANINRYKQLDLLLLTQGWRDFVWKQLVDSGVRIKYMIEPGFTISGRVRQKFVNKPITDATVSMFLTGSKKGIMYTKTDSLGKYFIDGVEFYGNKHLMLTSTDKKGKKTGWILRDTAKSETLPILFKNEWYPLNPEFSMFASEANSRKNAMKKFTLSDTIALSDVVISAINKKKDQQKTSAMIEGMDLGYDFTIGPDDYSFPSIGAFLLSKVPRAEPVVMDGVSSDSPDKVAFRNMGQLIKPRFVMDNMRINVDEEYVVYSLSMDQIDRIIVSRGDVNSSVLDNPDPSIDIRSRYVISIFTKPGARDKKDFYTINTYINGYYQARVFYSPKYTSSRNEGEKPDLRTTIYWNSNVVTNENGEASVTFSNADKPTLIRATTEGVTDKGAPVAGSGRYEVK